MDVETLNWPTEKGDHYAYKLWHELPKGSRTYVTKYIKLSAKEEGWKATVIHRKFSIEIILVSL